MKNLVLTLLLLPFFIVNLSISAFGKVNNDLDSLKSIIATNIDDFQRADIFYVLGQEYEDKNINESYCYYSASIQLSDKIGYIKRKIKAKNRMAWTYRLNNDIAKAEHLYYESINSAYQIGKAEALNGLGICAYHKGEYKQSIELYSKSLDIYKCENDKKSESDLLNNMAISYNRQGKHLLAMDYYFKALREIQKISPDNSIETLKIYFNIGNLYLDIEDYKKSTHYLKIVYDAYALKNVTKHRLGLINQSIALLLNKQGYRDSAYYHAGEAKKNYEHEDYMIGVVRCNVFIADYFKNQNQLNRSEKIYNEALGMINNHDYKGIKTELHNGLGQLYLTMNQTAKSFNHLNKALEIALDIGYTKEIINVYSNLSKIYELKGDYQQSLHIKKLHGNLRDSLQNIETLNKISNIESKYNYELLEYKKIVEMEKEVMELKLNYANSFYRDRIFKIIIFLACIIIAIIGVALVKEYTTSKKLKSKSNQLSDSNKLMDQAIKENNELVQLVSHDLRTPFNTIKGLTNLLNITDEKSESQHYLIRIEEVTNNSLNMIKSILNRSKVALTSLTPNLEKINILKAVSSIVEISRVLANQKEIMLLETSIGSRFLCMSDKMFLRQIVENLLSNAIKYSSRGGKVWISVINNAEGIAIEVRDEGSGMSKGDLNRLFKKYPKISSMPTSREDSVGLGLYNANFLAKMMNGSISCTSKLGRGTTFRWTLYESA